MPLVVDDASEYLPDTIDADLVLDFLKHPDLSHDLALLCRRLSIPIVASGKKPRWPGTHTPPVCCALARHRELGPYSRCFGAPEFDVIVKDGKISDVTVRRGAPCGATWEAARRIKGYSVEEAPVRIGLDTQFFCTADPANWDPIWGKSPVHLAADLHRAALVAALKKASEDTNAINPCEGDGSGTIADIRRSADGVRGLRHDRDRIGIRKNRRLACQK
jgi:hypothetical protein